MRKVSVLFIALIVFAACGTSNNAKVKIADPEIHLEQVSAQPAVAEHITGGVPVYFALSVTNHADIPITLKRINVQSMGSGGYNVPSTSRPTDKVIAPGATEQIEFPVAAYATDSVAGVNGAVAMRVIAQFDSSVGAFENSTVHQVEGRLR